MNWKAKRGGVANMEKPPDIKTAEMPLSAPYQSRNENMRNEEWRRERQRGPFAVTTITLKRLVEDINRDELIEDFVQRAQRLHLENPALKSYNVTIKSFTALSKSLLDLLPEKTQKQAGEELLTFATKLPGAGRPTGRKSKAGEPSQAAASGQSMNGLQKRYRTQTPPPHIVSMKKSGNARYCLPSGSANCHRE